MFCRRIRSYLPCVCVCDLCLAIKLPAFLSHSCETPCDMQIILYGIALNRPCSLTAYSPWLPDQLQNLMIAEISFWLTDVITVNMGVNKSGFAFSTLWSLWLMFSRGQLHQQCCEEWTLVSEETQAKMARMAAAAAWGLGNHSNTLYSIRKNNMVAPSRVSCMEHWGQPLSDSVQRCNQIEQQWKQ